MATPTDKSLPPPPPRPPADRAAGWRQRRLFALFIPESVPLDLRIVGRTLFHAAIVGVAAGLMGAAFFAGARGACSA